jgi:ATP-binding cassette subfamily B protein RaxB
MILNWHGHHLLLSDLRALHPTGHALSLEALAGFAERHGLDTRALRCDLMDLRQIQLPAIIHFDFDHFVVLEKITNRYAVIVDPSQGRIKLPRTSLSKRFTGIVLELEPGPEFKAQGAPRSYSPIRFLSQIPMLTLTGPLLSLLALSFVIQCFALVSPFYLQIVIDEVLQENNPDLAVVLAAGFAMVYLISAVTQWFRGLLVLHIGNRLSFLLASGLMQKLISLPLAFFARRNVGDVVSRFGSSKPIQDFLTDSAVRVFLDALMVVTTFILLASYSARIALTVSLFGTLFVCIQYAIYLPFRQRNHEALIAEAAVQSHFIETIQSIDTIARFQAERRRTATWMNKLAAAISTRVKAGRLQLGFEVSRYLMGGLTLVVVVYVAVTEVMAATLTLGMVYAAVSYTNHLTTALLSLVAEWQQFMMLSLHVQRLSDITEQPEKVNNRIPAPAEISSIVFRQAGFSYETHKILDNFNLVIGKDEKVALIGHSGTGKSTLLSLLTGQVQLNSGEISINGRPLTPQVDTRSLFASVSQFDSLLAGTIAENISCQDPFPDTDRIIRCARLAEIHDDLQRLPLAYDERLGEMGSSLSAGQRQRILIARALYRNAPILLLDEGTCHLDEATECRVMNNILQLPCICLFISHRKAVTRLADKTISLPGKSGTEIQFAAS